jgi:hypothetical protein
MFHIRSERTERNKGQNVYIAMGMKTKEYGKCLRSRAQTLRNSFEKA